MDDSLYDTSWLLHRVARVTPAFSALLHPSLSEQNGQHPLSHHAEALRASLSKDRPRYEEVEEQEKLGGLKQCTWRLLRSVAADGESSKRKREDRSTSTLSDGYGLIISLVYDKATYRFIMYTKDTVGGGSGNEPPLKRSRVGASSTRLPFKTTSNTPGTAILLSKSSPSALQALTTYLADTFGITEISPLKLPSVLIQSTLETYLRSVSTALKRIDMDNAARRSTFQSLTGTLSLTISFAPPVAPSLKTLDIKIPPVTLDQHYRSILDGDEVDDGQAEFMPALATWILSKTGLQINPAAHTGQYDEDNDIEQDRNTDTATPAVSRSQASQADGPSEAPAWKPTKAQVPVSPMRISRISTIAYAVSVEGRLKFASKPVDTVDAIIEENKGADECDNMVRTANEELLDAVLVEARRQPSE